MATSMIRAGRRLAEMMDAPWTAVHVERPSQRPATAEQAHLCETLGAEGEIGRSDVRAHRCWIVDGHLDSPSCSDTTSECSGDSIFRSALAFQLFGVVFSLKELKRSGENSIAGFGSKTGRYPFGFGLIRSGTCQFFSVGQD